MERLFPRLDFYDFEPSKELRTLAHEILDKVFEQSPSDSYSVASLKKTAAGFEGLLKISSFAGTFAAHAMSSDPLVTVERLCEVVLAQIDGWRRRRD